MAPELRIMWEDGADRDLALPAYETPGAAGADIRANLAEADRAAGVTLQPMERRIIPSGLRVEIPAGFEMQIRPRSGLAAKNGVSIVNAPGTVDCDYRGEISVCLINLGAEIFHVRRGDRIAQGIIAAAPQWTLIEADELDETVRGAGYRLAAPR